MEQPRHLLEALALPRRRCARPAPMSWRGAQRRECARGLAQAGRVGVARCACREHAASVRRSTHRARRAPRARAGRADRAHSRSRFFATSVRERARQPSADLVELLAAQREELVERRQRAGRARRTRAGAPPCRAGAQARGGSRARASPRASSARTGTAISAAPVGVGARRSAAWSISVQSVSWPTAEITGMRARRDGAHRHLLVEGPEILDRAAAARDDQKVGARHRPPGGDGVEAAHRRRDFLGRAVPLHAHRPDQHVARKAVAQPMQDVADHRAGRRGDDADDARQIRDRLLARRRRTAPRLRASSAAPRAAPSARRRPPARGGR